MIGTSLHNKDTYSIFGCVVLRLEGAEKSLLSTKNLDGRTGRLGEVHERSGVSDKTCTNKLTDKCCQVRRKSLHTAREVVAKILAMSEHGLARCTYERSM